MLRLLVSDITTVYVNGNEILRRLYDAVRDGENRVSVSVSLIVRASGVRDDVMLVDFVITLVFV